MWEERQVCCGFALACCGEDFGSSGISWCGSWWTPAAFTGSGSISSPALALPLAGKSAGAQWGPGGVSGKPSLDTVGSMDPRVKLSGAV